MKNFIIITLIIVPLSKRLWQSDDEMLVNKFLNDLKEKTLENVFLTYFESPNTSAEKKELIFLLLKSINDQIGDRDIDVYSKLEKPNLFEEIKSERSLNSQFVALLDDNPITFFLVEDGKMIAISTIKKGSRSYYLMIDE